MEITHRLTWEQVTGLATRFAGSSEPGKGVLSIYLQLPPADRHERRRWQTTLNSGLTELRAGYRGDRELDRLAETAAEHLLGLPPEARTSGLIFLAGVDGSRWLEFTRLPVGTHFAWQERPLLQPLVAALNAAPLTGVVVLAQDQARLLTWDQGSLHEEAVLTADIDTSDWRQYAAGSGGGSARTSTNVDDFRARFEEQLDKFVRGLAREVSEHARKNRWELVMPVTQPKLAEAIGAALPPALRSHMLSGADVNLIRADNESLADHITVALATWSEAKQDAEVEQAIRIAQSRGPAALGPADCLNLLGQYRVEHLLYDSSLRLGGYLRPDGSLSLDPDPSSEGQRLEANLTEWAIAACLATNTRVTPVHGAAAARLGPAGGMVATLRY